VAKLNVGLVGLGRMAMIHATNLRRLPEAKLVAVVHRDLVKAKRGAAQLEIEHSYDSVEAMLEHPGLDAVIIASPTQFHPSAVIAAAGAKKHIFCEKPLALTVAECDTAIAAVSRAGVLLHVAFNRRFDPPFVAARQRIAAGEIGTPVIFRSVSRDREMAPVSYHESGSGPLFVDMGIHDCDVARWLTGDEVAEVHAFGGNIVSPELARLGDSDAGMANLRFSQGALGNIELFRQALYGYDIFAEVIGTRGAVRIDHLRQTPLTVLKPDGIAHDAFTGFITRYEQAFADELKAFVHAVLTGAPAPVTGEDAKRALAIALAADRSRREGRPVLVSEIAQTASTAR
jgi:inositol 2-dehydrogenase